jgi:hypothetical protein
MNKNYLDTKRYLISETMHNALVNERLDDTNSVVKQDSGIYVISVRLLQRGTNNLVYNYVYYSSIFLQTYLHFLMNKNVNSIRFKE